MIHPKYPKSKKLKSETGFSLIEMIVSISIILIITSVVLVRQSAFTSTVLLKNLAYGVALSVREVQTAAVSVRGRNGIFDVPYGIHFDIDKDNQYVLFRDVKPVSNINDKYDVGDTEELVDTVTINKNFKIKNLCYEDSTGRICHKDDGSGVTEDSNFKELVVIFKRPDFDALFNVDNNTNDLDSDIIEVEVVLSGRADDALERVITVNSTGFVGIGS